MQLPEGFDPLKGYDGYGISRNGEIISSKRLCTWRRLKGQPDKEGYLHVHIGGKKWPISRLVAIQYIPNTENKPQVAHIDGNKENNSAGNLRWSTQQENIADRQKHETTQKGARHFKAKLNPLKVRVIWHLLADGMKQYEIAKIFEVCPATICAVNLGTTWYHEQQSKGLGVTI